MSSTVYWLILLKEENNIQLIEKMHTMYKCKRYNNITTLPTSD